MVNFWAGSKKPTITSGFVLQRGNLHEIGEQFVGQVII
jgi:hypothetical protein